LKKKIGRRKFCVISHEKFLHPTLTPILPPSSVLAPYCPKILSSLVTFFSVVVPMPT